MILMAYKNVKGDRIERIFVGNLDGILASMKIKKCDVVMVQHLN